MNYVEPDWESVYLNWERPRKPLGLQVCWEQYSKRAARGGGGVRWDVLSREMSQHGPDTT